MINTGKKIVGSIHRKPLSDDPNPLEIAASNFIVEDFIEADEVNNESPESEMIGDSLEQLVKDGRMELVKDDPDPEKRQYRLTQKGRDFVEKKLRKKKQEK